MPVVVNGLKELRAELRALERSAPREITAALKEGAVDVAKRAAELAPQGKTGRLKGNARPWATMRSAGVKFTLVYAPVQEFAVTWMRKNPGGAATGGSVTRGQKKAHFAGGLTVGGTNEVHYTKLGAPPRFAFKAVTELGPDLVESTFERLLNVLRAHGWFG